jgi:hypothetical protein
MWHLLSVVDENVIRTANFILKEVNRQYNRQMLDYFIGSIIGAVIFGIMGCIIDNHRNKRRG